MNREEAIAAKEDLIRELERTIDKVCDDIISSVNDSKNNCFVDEDNFYKMTYILDSLDEIYLTSQLLYQTIISLRHRSKSDSKFRQQINITDE